MTRQDYFTPQKKGTYAIGYQSDFTNIEIDPDTFLKYLTDEGLDHAIEYRKQNLLTQSPGRENYIRHCKTLVQSGDKFDIDNSMLTFGYELEIIPLSNPYKKQLNDSLSVKVVYQNQPIENLLLIALPKTEPDKITGYTHRPEWSCDYPSGPERPLVTEGGTYY